MHNLSIGEYDADTLADTSASSLPNWTVIA